MEKPGAGRTNRSRPKTFPSGTPGPTGASRGISLSHLSRDGFHGTNPRHNLTTHTQGAASRNRLSDSAARPGTARY
jgi:hypothetical protein